jgi:hypothetical protein
MREKFKLMKSLVEEILKEEDAFITRNNLNQIIKIAKSLKPHIEEWVAKCFSATNQFFDYGG